MPRLPYYAFYVADYRADTRHLTPMQHFAYREILDEIFLSGQHQFPPSIPDDDDFLREICRPQSDSEWKQTRRALIDGPRALLHSENGHLSQKRMTIEVEKALKRAQKAIGANRARWGIPEQGEGTGNAATGKSGPVSGNGSGPGSMKDGQYAFFTTQISRWREKVGDLYVGDSGGTAFEEAFQREFGMTWARWQEEVLYHTRRN